MAISSNFPAIKPTLLLDFANVEQLDPRITFARASTATYYGTQTAKAEENLLLQSQDFTTTWSSAENVSVTANTTTAPDGTATADTLAETAVTGIHTASQSSSSTGVLTFSVFAKPDSGTPFLTIGISSSGTSHSSATFDLSLGTNTQTQANGGNYTSPSATITAVAQGFYRCTFTVTTTDTATLFRIGLNNTGTPTASNRGFGATYLGVVTNSIFVWGAQLEQRSVATAYTATTTQPITNYIPVLQTAASGVARFDHNPTTFESLGLEIEEQRTNLLVRSEEFQTTWTNIDSTEQTDVIVSPAGTLTGDKIVEDTGSVTPFLTQSVSVTSGTAYTFSVYGKEDPTSAKRYLMLLLPSAQFGANIRVSVNLATGAVATSGSPAATSATAVGNGWYRISVTASATATGSATIQVRLTNDANAGISAYTGDGYSGIYIWGAQLEAGAFPTSYIPTVASQVTRAADAASMTGTNFSSWYNAAEGTLYAESAFTGLVTSARIVQLDDGTTSNFISLQNNPSTATTSQLRVFVNGTNTVFTGISSAYAANTFAKTAAAIAVDNFATTVNSAAVGTDTSSGVPVVNTLRIGASSSAVSNVLIKKLAYYPIRCTNAQLQGLTS